MKHPWRAFRTAHVFGILLALHVAGMSIPVRAQVETYPNRPVKVVVPAAPGGGLDLISRVLAQKASEILGQQFFIDNKPGANWIIGMENVANSQPDGYTLLVVSSAGITINPYIFKGMSIEPLRDLVPITLVDTTAYVLLVNPQLGVKTVGEFIAYLKAHPGKLNHASNSASTMLVSEYFKSRAGADYVDVNYRGASQAINDTIAGATQFCFVDFASATTVMKNRTLIPLGVSSAERYPLAPQLPTIAEQGLAGFSVSSLSGIFAPAKTPKAIMTKLNTSFHKVLADPQVAARLKEMGFSLASSSSEELTQLLRAQANQWQSFIKEHHIKLAQ